MVGAGSGSAAPRLLLGREPKPESLSRQSEAGGLTGIGKAETLPIFSPSAGVILDLPSFSTSSIRMMACSGMYVTFTPLNSALSFSSEGSTTSFERSPKRMSPTSTNAYIAPWVTSCAYNS